MAHGSSRSEKPSSESFDGVTGRMHLEVTRWQKHKIFYVFAGAVLGWIEFVPHSSTDGRLHETIWMTG